MNVPSPQDHERLSDRVVELETLYTHLQRAHAELDQVVLEQRKVLESLERRVTALERELSEVAGSITEERRPEDEKPPHY